LVKKSSKKMKMAPNAGPREIERGGVVVTGKVTTL
jgi:hypothetical protein